MQIFKFANLSKIPWLGHGISTKDFGNLSLFTGNDKKRVLQSRAKFFSAIGDLSEKDVVEPRQIHTNHVKVVGEKEKGHLILDTDALITNTPNVVLLIKVADCVPIFLLDVQKKVVGAVHAGWRGVVQEITRLAVNHMEDHFGTSPQDLVVGIGPSIGPCCYEVDTPVIEQFKYKFKYAEKLFSKQSGSRAHLDLWLANKFQLIESGVKEKNIEVAGVCTYDNPETYFSDRKNRSEGRFGAVIWLCPELVEGIKG